MSFRLGIILIATVAVAALLVAAPWSGRESAALQQPIQFNHQVHVKKEPCQTCHRAYQHGPAAGNPTMVICMDCHTNPVGESAEEEKLRALEKNQGRLNWIRVTRVPRHVRFSHQRHVVVGKLPCENCHGDIASLTTPPLAPLVAINMNFCIGCHRSERFRFMPGVQAKLAGNDFDPEFVESLGRLMGRGFRTREAFFATLDAASPEPLSPSQQKMVLSQTQAATPVSTDCIACHR